jgi:[acyl-carrier-protein] S-malonyltransferase
VAIAKHLQEKGIQPQACTGHSLGEISALVISGACPFADALRLTFERARLMSEDLPKGGMAAVIGFDPALIESLLPEGVQIANYNGPGQTIISGRLDALEEAMPALKDAGAKRVLPLKVSGPFHSECMRPAVAEFQNVLDTIPFEAPKTTFISSVSGQEENDPARIRTLLGEQLVSPVRWTQVMELVGAVPALEVGPGTVLKGLARRMENAPTIQTTGSLEEIEALEI